PAAARPSAPAAAAVTHPSAAPARMLVPATLEPDDSDGAGDGLSALEFDDQLDARFVAPRNGAPNAAPLVHPTTGMRAVQARRRRLNQWLTLALGVLTLILFVVAVMVLNRDPAPQPSASPAAATAPASPTIPTPGS
ncbi:MAG TPA: hypothetical protein VEQ85_04090, partial [Lacipirellulaceae bacterium]|nr:hypothetical protein [Lacipirellulaceae bacterium]